MRDLTDLQRRALRIIQQRPGMTCQDLAYELLDERRTSGSKGLTWPQAATRWGSSYAARMERRGVILIDRAARHGGKLSLTARGREAMDAT